MVTSPYSSIFETWSRTSMRAFESAIAANRAAFSAFNVSPVSFDPGSDSAEPVERAEESVEEQLEPAGDLSEWDVELNTGREIDIGDSLRFTKTISEDDVERFAAASGDTNPIHLDDEWARETRFNGRIVHGVLATGLISAALARLPGNVIYLSQDVEFRAPVRLGDRITAEIEVAEDLGGGRYRLRTTVSRDEELVIDGEAVVLIDDDPDA